MNIRSTLYVLSCILVLSGCAQRQEHADLHRFMEDVRARPSGEIEPLPTFRPFKTFNYSAVAMRSPFDAPVLLGVEETVSGKSTVKPDEGRKKEHLEGFSFSALSLVGTLEQANVIWALIDDGEGGVHRVKSKNYVGRNHGQIIAVNNARVDVVEIVPDGKGGWVERPRALALREKE